MTFRNCLAAILFLTLVKSFGQVDNSNIRLQVLRQNKIGKEFKFLNTKDSSVTYLKYLGQLTAKHGDIYKVVISTWTWGLSHRATNRIMIFDAKNKYLGDFYVTTTLDLPDKIKSNKLIFLNSDTNCDEKLITELSFNDGIPKKFFRKCKGNAGDIYSFSKDE